MKAFKHWIIAAVVAVAGLVAYTAWAADVSCRYGNCDVRLYEDYGGQGGWLLMIDCDDGSYGSWVGSGDYTGTVCGGEG